MKTIFSFPYLETLGDDNENTHFVVEDEKRVRRVLRSSEGGFSEITVKRLKEKLVEYEEAISYTRAAISLLRG